MNLPPLEKAPALTLEQSIHLLAYSKFLRGEVTLRVFSQYLGVCGNCISIKLNNYIKYYFADYLAYERIVSYTENGKLFVKDSVSISNFGLNPKIVVGLVLGDDFYFRNSEARLRFVEFIIKHY